MKQGSRSFWIAGGVYLCCLATISPVQAQVSSDETLSTKVSTTDDLNFKITNGEQAGNNLFHSFGNFSVPTGGSAFFDNASDIRNIISRVTGSSVSNIDGLIRSNFSANLFLLNPKGITFGPNASLNIGGAFVVSTASKLNFADGQQFSAEAPQAAPLLTMSVPIGLQFGANSEKILVQGNGQGLRNTTDIVDTTDGLRVQPNQTLALVGGDVVVEGGTLKTAGGRIELGSVAGSSLVNLTLLADKGWTLDYHRVQNFRDIQLSQQAAIDASGAGGGDIQIRGRQVRLTDGSQIESSTLGAEPGGMLAVTASEVELVGNSLDGQFPTGLAALVYPEASGAGGSLTIETRQLSIQDGAQIGVSTYGAGAAGALTVYASDLVELGGEGQDASSGLFAQADSEEPTGSGGSLNIETGRLIVRGGAQVSTSTFGAGNAGTLTVRASDFVELSGEGRPGISGLFSQADSEATGGGGSLNIETGRLIVRDGAQVSTSTSGAGNAGTLTVRASDFVELSGEGRLGISGLFSQANPESMGFGGNLTIETGRLDVQNGAQIAVRSFGISNAGNLFIDSDLIKLEQGTITAETQSGEGGNINIQGGSIQLRNHSLISTTAGRAGSSGDGGNIFIDTDFIIAVPSENSDIKANAFLGRGGQVSINAVSIFGLVQRNLEDLQTLLAPNDPDQLDPINLNTSDITAISQTDPSLGGQVTINTPDVDPGRGLVTLSTDLVDASGLIAQSCRGTASEQNRFIVTGRGGLPPSPSDTLSSQAVWQDLRPPAQQVAESSSSEVSSSQSDVKRTPGPSSPIVEAQGWVISPNGQVILTAQAPIVNAHDFRLALGPVCKP